MKPSVKLFLLIFSLNIYLPLEDLFSQIQRTNTITLFSTNEKNLIFSSDSEEESVENILPDTVFARSINDSVRFSYTFISDDVVEIQQKYLNNLWQNVTRYSIKKLPGKILRITEIWNGSNWESLSRWTEEYDQLGSLILFSEENFTEGAWKYFNRLTWSYKNGVKESYMREYFNNGLVVLKLLETYSYNEQNLLTGFLLQYEQSGVWTNSSKGEWIINSQGNPEEYFYRIWRNNSWNDSSHVNYYYDFNGNDTLTVMDLFNGSTWHNHLMQKSSFNNTGNRLSREFYRWSIDWYKWLKFNWEYDEFNQVITELYSRGENNEWVNYSKESFIYHSKYRLSSDLCEYWEENNWKNYSLELLKYDLENNISSYESFKWNNGWQYSDNTITIVDQDANSFWYFGHKINFCYNPVSSVQNNITLNNFELLQNYPNPFNSSTRIKISAGSAAHLSLRVYDILGNEIALLINEEKDAGFYEINFPAGELSSGIYIYQLTADGISVSGKMLLIR